MDYLKTFEAMRDKYNGFYMITDKDGNILGYNLSKKDKEKVRYGYQNRYLKKGYKLAHVPSTINFIQMDKNKNVIRFDSFENAKKWYDERNKKALDKYLKKVPKNKLGEQLYELSEIVKKKYPHINKGTCYYFQHLITIYFPEINNFVLLFDETEEEPIHVMCKINRYYYDGTGFFTKSELKNNYGHDIIIVDADKKDIEYWNVRCDLDTVDMCLTTMPLSLEEREDLKNIFKNIKK